MQGNSAVSVSANALMQAYYGEVLDDTLHQTLTGPLQPSIHSACLPDSASPSDDQPAIKTAMEEFKSKIVAGMNGTPIAWANSHLPVLQSVRDTFNRLKTLPSREWGHIRDAWGFVSHETMYQLLGIGLGPQMNWEVFELSYDIYSELLDIFENVYFQSVMVFKPRISSDHLSVSDPFYRQLVRAANMNDPEIDRALFTPSFNIKKFVFKCLITLFPVIEYDNISSNNRAQQVKALRLVLQLFEYGLWTIDEMEELVGRVYQCSSRMLSWEKCLIAVCFEEMVGSNDPDAADTWMKEPSNFDKEVNVHHFPKLSDTKIVDFAQAHAKQIIQARVLMAKIMAHIVTMHMDFEVEVSYSRMGLRPPVTASGHARSPPEKTISPDMVFAFDRMKKKRLYTYLSYVMVNYLMEDLPDVIINFQRGLYDKLGLINSLLMAHTSNIKADFVFNSLLSLDPANLSFYLMSPSSGFPLMFRQAFERIKGEVVKAMKSGWWRSGQVDRQFLFWFSGEVRQLGNIFGDTSSLEELKAAQLGCSLVRMDHLLLSVLTSLVTSLGKDGVSQIHPVLQETLDFVVLSNKDNLQCVNSFLTFFVLKHFLALYDHLPHHGAYVLMQLLRNRRCTKLFISHEKIKKFVLDKFKTGLTQLFAGVSVGSPEMPRVTFETLLEIVFLCKLVKSVVKENDINSVRVSSTWSNELVLHLESMGLVTCHLQTAMAGKGAGLPKMATLEDFMRHGKAVAESGPEGNHYALLWTLSQVQGLLSATSRSQYFFSAQCLGERTIANLTIDDPSSYFLRLDWDLAMTYYRKCVEVWANFCIFPENHFLSNKFDKNMLLSYVNSTSKRGSIAQELEEVVQRTLGVVTSGMGQEPAAIKLVFKAVLPAMLKYVSGLLNVYTDERFKKMDSTQRRYLLAIVDQMSQAASGLSIALEGHLSMERCPSQDHSGYQSIQNFLDQIDLENANLIPRRTLNGITDNIKRKLFEIMTHIVKPYRFRIQYFRLITKFYKFDEKVHEKKFLDRMTINLSSHFKFREEYHLCDQQRPVPWNQDVIHQQRHSPNRPSLLTLPGHCQPLNVSLTACQNGSPTDRGLLAKFDCADDTPAICHNVVYFYQQRYWALKCSMIDKYQNNQVFRILKYPDPIYKNISVFVNYLMKELQQINSELGQNDRVVFNFNDRFKTLLIMADNLFRVSPSFRVEFLRELSNKRYPETMFKLWSLKQMLFDQVAYWTFINDTWDATFAGFYLVSCFVQTLCENNYVPFKEVLCNEDGDDIKPWALSSHDTWTRKAAKEGSSYLAHYHKSIQKVLLESEVHHKEKQEIDVRDRQDFTRVYCRAIEELNEYITGGSIDPLPVFRTRVDIWTGILFRREENPDSPFYQTKYNVALYLNSFTESASRTIMGYLSNKIFVGDLIDECVHMVWLLFRRETPCYSANYQPPWYKRLFGGGAVRRRVKDKTGRWVQPIELDGGRLVDLYKSNQNRFADHVIIDIIVTLFRFIKQLQQHDLRYSHFITSLDELVALGASRPKRSFFRMSTWTNQSQEAAVGIKSSRLAGQKGSHHLGPDKPIDVSMFTYNQVTCWQFMKEIVCEVELQVTAKNEARKSTLQLIPYQFKKLPVCFFDSLDLQMRFLQEAPYGSLEEKQEDFVKNIRHGIVQLESEQANFLRLGRASWVVSDRMFDGFLALMYAIVVTINIICLICYNPQTGLFDSPDYGDLTTAVMGLTIADAALALLLVVAWFLFKLDTQRKLYKLTYAKELTSRGFWGPFVKLKAVGSIVLSNNICLSLLLHLTLSLLGFWSPFFYTLMLFLILHFSSLLRGVVNAILSNLLRLFWTLVIIVIVLNFFSLIVTKYYNASLTEESTNGCDSYFGCLINTLNMGVVQDGGVSSYLQFAGDIRGKDYSGMFFTRLFAYILVNLFLLGMFFGIITDAFSEYVKQLTEKDQDLKTVCFCCGLKASTLERYGVPFDIHVEQHSIFKYMYYAIYLEKLDLNEYSGVDYQVDKILKSNNKVAMLPKYRAVSLEQKGIRVAEEEAKGEARD